MTTSMPMKRPTAKVLVCSLLLAATLILSGCGPIMSLLCSGEKQTDMDCSTENPRPEKTAP